MRAVQLLSVLYLVVVLLAGCGGGAGTTAATGNSTTNPPPSSSTTTPSPVVTNPTSNYVRLISDPGDYVGQGQTYLYTPDIATIDLAGSGNLIQISIHGAKDWIGTFKAPDSANKFVAGTTYSAIQGYPYHDPAAGGMNWSGDGRACNMLTASMTIDKITYINQTISAVDMRFDQDCSGISAALHGEIHWVGDPALLPIGATPPGTWAPPMGVAPTNMVNYVYLESDIGDFVGGGWIYAYTQADSILSATVYGSKLSFSVTGDQSWSGWFQETDVAGQLQTGYVGSMQFDPLTNFSMWSGEGRGCTSYSGWFIIDKATYAAGALTELDLRFEQLCADSTYALHGAIHWSSADITAPPGPVTPPPVDLWQPPVGVTPAAGNFAYFESDPADFVGKGKSYLYTQANSRFSVSSPANSLNELTVKIEGDLPWNGSVIGMNSMTQLQPGYYSGVLRAPFHNPVKGGSSWSGSTRGCNQSYGWFVIDNVTYTAGVLTALDLRFEQHCEGATPALRGAIHWTPTDTTMPPGPVSPAPANLWTPPAGSVPVTGNYIYMQSQPGNYVGQGLTYLYTPATATVTQTTFGNRLNLDIAGANHWTGSLQAMYFLSSLVPGYYEVNDANYYNPVKGDMAWGMDSYGCSNPVGWFVVDNVTYLNGAVSSIDARFMQQCYLEVAPLYGAIHWVF
ncbi:MAG: hypothetical protein PHH36_00885 [Sideroxydans sp.]|nr:hypothetical protein [Sideroxydans sp.]